MLSTTKAIINSLNQFKYLRNINRVRLRETNIDSNYKNSSFSLKNIEKLENEVRVDNLRVFIRNYTKLRLKRFWFVSFPALLTASSIIAFSPPSKLPTRDKLPTYNHEMTDYNSNYGVRKVSEPVYVTDEGFKNYTLKDDNKGIKEGDVKDNIVFQMSNNDNYLVANLNISKGDMLSVSDVTVGDHFDFTEYNESEYTYDESDNFDLLYDKIVKMINEYVYLNDEEKEVLNKLSESDKKNVVIEVSKYVDLGETSLDVYKPKTVLKGVLICLLAINALINGLYLSDHKEVLSNFKELKHDGEGHLFEYGKRKTNIIYESIRYKEAFLAAERERLKMLEDEVEKNINFSDRQKLFTRYEAKLLAKENKKNN